MNSDLHLFNQLFEEGEGPSFHLAPALPSLQELFADWLDLFLQAWELPTHTAGRWEELRGYTRCLIEYLCSIAGVINWKGNCGN